MLIRQRTPDYAKALIIKERVSQEAQRLMKLDESIVDLRPNFPGAVEVLNQRTQPYTDEYWIRASLSFDPATQTPTYMESRTEHLNTLPEDKTTFSLMQLGDKIDYSITEHKNGHRVYQLVEEDLKTHELTYILR